MGVVYGGYDPQLDRKVALKLLHGGKGGSRPAARWERARLIREAQSMARLSDPNVVTVHDVGEHEGQVFVAMEYVEGSTLTEWIATGRSHRELLDAFVQAGRGLAAAHAKGLVHRDFKPDNVMVEAGASPRVRVMDFGLALPLEVADAAPSDPSAEASSSTTGLTRAGAIVGTPAYMAPEQWHGEVADARSDQFAFCVALWEALHGQRPFVGDDVVDLAVAVTEGRIEDPRTAAVPARLTRVLRRGLACDPEARFKDMDALLADIDPSPRRRPWGIFLIGTALVGATAGAIAYGEWEADAECRAGRERFADLRLEDRLSLARTAFTTTELPYAETVFADIESRVQGTADAWLRQHELVCPETPHRGRGGDGMPRATPGRARRRARRARRGRCCDRGACTRGQPVAPVAGWLRGRGPPPRRQPDPR